MLRVWRHHSLSITLLVVGAVLIAISLPFGPGQTFDIISMIGGSFLTVALYNLLSGPLREKNRPDA